jgi:ArsR family transcriptional regulator
VELIQIYQCFCDHTRLRILHLLGNGPLCVCHFQSLLDESQVKISKHLAYLKDKGLVEAHRYQNWMIYSLPAKRSAELEKNLKCLQDCVQTDPTFKKDLRKLQALNPEIDWIEGALSCCEPDTAASAGASGTKERNRS